MNRTRLFSHFALTISVLLFFNYNALFAQETEETVNDSITVTFLANSGIIITYGDVKIAIDALYEGMHNSTHVDPSTNALSDMNSCSGLFSDIDIIAISHEHSDHFDADVVGKNMECNTNAVVLCDEAVGTMLEDYANYNAIKDRIQVYMPQENSFIIDTLYNISVKIFRFKHGMSFFSSMVNLAFLIDLDGYKIYHSGDTHGEYIDEFEAFELYKEDIDLAFLHINMFDGESDDPEAGYALVEEYISPDSIVLIHNYPANLNGGHDVIDALSDETQNIFVFDEEMQTLKIPHKASGSITELKMEQIIEFREGWNLFSLYVEPNTLLIDSVFAAITDNLVAVKDFDQSYVTGRDDFMNTLAYIAYGKAYFVKVDSDLLFSLYGDEFTCEKNGAVQLKNDWNLIGVPFIGEFSFPSDFSGIENSINLIKDFDTFYMPNNIFSTLKEVTSGQGYLLKMNGESSMFCEQ